MQVFMGEGLQKCWHIMSLIELVVEVLDRGAIFESAHSTAKTTA